MDWPDLKKLTEWCQVTVLLTVEFLGRTVSVNGDIIHTFKIEAIFLIN